MFSLFPIKKKRVYIEYGMYAHPFKLYVTAVVKFKREIKLEIFEEKNSADICKTWWPISVYQDFFRTFREKKLGRV